MNTEPAPIRVSCPECHVPYLLPARLLGPGGARVRCPACDSSFDVAPPAAQTDVLAEPDPAIATEPVLGVATGPAPGAATEPAREAASEPATPEAVATGSSPAPVPGDSAPLAREVAREVLDALAQHVGPDLERVVAEGRVFARFGPEIFAAYDEYRRRAKEGGADPFRIALRDRFGVDLPEVTPRF